MKLAAWVCAFALLSCARQSQAALSLPWPSYLATDYGKPGQPELSVPDVAQLQSVLAQARPCQRDLVRYAIAKDGRFVVFLLPLLMPFTNTHVLGEGNLFYDGYQGTAYTSPSGGATEKAVSVRYELAQIGCDGLWPRYLAEDYRLPDHPRLTEAEVARIRWMLGRVKPCKRHILAYAFDSGGPSTEAIPGMDSRGFVMFLGWSDPHYRWLAEPHVLGGQNIMYHYEGGRVDAFPNTEGDRFTIQGDIDRTACNGKPIN